MTISEKINIAIKSAEEMIAYHGLDFSVMVNRRRVTLAETHHDDKTIFLSRWFIIATDKRTFEGVVLHEIAHAMLGPGFGHGEEFQELCGMISPTDDFILPHTGRTPTQRYKYECEGCDYFGFSNAKRHDLGCAACASIGVNSRLAPAKNNIELKEW